MLHRDVSTVGVRLVLFSDYLESVLFAQGVFLDGEESVCLVSEDAQLLLH